MTRGTFYLITDSKVLESTGFNGDMYPEGRGDDALSLLRAVSDEKEFKEMVKEFNQTHHDYEGKLIYETKNMFDNDSFIDFNVNYFERFFSDWLFIKNLSKKDITFNDRENIDDVIKNGDTIRLSFGHIEECSRKLLSEINEKKS